MEIKTSSQRIFLKFYTLFINCFRYLPIEKIRSLNNKYRKEVISMAISPVQNPVQNQANQSVSSASSSSATTSYPATPVTSTNPTVLAQQEKTVRNEIAQLQRNHGSTQNIQQLNQELQQIQKQIKAGSSATQATEQPSAPASSSNVLDVKA